MRKLLLATTFAVTATQAFAADTDGNLGLGFTMLGLLLLIYFLPALIGIHRHVNASAVLFLVNLILGWTVLGWFFCLLWAVSGKTREEDAFFRGAAKR